MRARPTSVLWVLTLASAALVAAAALMWTDLNREASRSHSPQPSNASQRIAPAESAQERLERLLPATPARWSRMRAGSHEVSVEQMPLQQIKRGRHSGIFGARPEGYRPAAIVVHSTGSGEPGSEFGSLEQLGGFFQRNGVAASHYAVDREGRVMQFVEDRNAAFHVATPGWNGISIGIELINDGTGTQSFPAAQKSAARRLIAKLGATYGIPLEAVVRHRDIQSADRSDPAENFGWDDFVESLREPRDVTPSGRLPQGTERLAVSRGDDVLVR